MTRRDYILIATALRSARVTNYISERSRDLYNAGIDAAVQHIADALEADNPAFDRKKFSEAAIRGGKL